MTREPTVRFTVSLPADLLRELDRRYVHRGYASRSELVRDLIRAQLVQDRWREDDATVLGVLTLAYDHHRRGLVRRLHAIQHDHYVHTLCATHVHVDHDHCLEVVILRGPAPAIEALAVQLRGVRGVTFAELTRAGSGEPGEAPGLRDGHGHRHAPASR